MNREEIPRMRPVRAEIVPDVSKKRMIPLLTPPPDDPPSYRLQIFLLTKLVNDLHNDGNL